jgi:transposase InsO family protein
VLDLFDERGPAEHIRSDNGSEFIATAVQKWLRQVGMKTFYIAPGSPWQNSDSESFNGSLREELLNGEIFYSLVEAKVLIGVAAALQLRPTAQQPGLPTAGPGNDNTAITALRFRFAPPPNGNGGRDDNALMNKLDDPVGAAQRQRRDH